ncbi:hypothetical protein CJU89_6867 [Yarrowia sp. B02]|nr:hypothetical protein CJU89_6867 [Yarrowia sp. B02]
MLKSGLSKMVNSIKVGFVPEHFSTPLFFAQTHGFYAQNGVSVDLKPFPSGSGHMIQSLESGEIDYAIGLTEAFVAGIGKGMTHYKVVGTYVDTPLCWAISSGSHRSDVTSEDQLEGKTLGISRIGSGSYVMPFVLAHNKGWSKEFKWEILSTFKNLRDSVNHTGEVAQSDAFMWEVFTQKKYYDSGEIKKIGQIYTPWPSWVIVEKAGLPKSEETTPALLKSINQGIDYFNKHQDEAVEHIYTTLDYSKEDATAWLDTVKFADDVAKIDMKKVITNTVDMLKEAKMLDKEADEKVYVKEYDI